MRKSALPALMLVQCFGWGASHALLVGVGKYKEFPDKSLDGPPYDVRELKRTLVENWGFPAENVTDLVDEKATSAGIRAALETLRNKVHAGDNVFIYFSGHGTSAFDPKMGSICSDLASGCLIPYDVRNGTPQEVMASLLLGRRDFRPVLLEIEKKNPASVFVSFDACYSENSAKSVLSARATTREFPMTALVTRGATDDDYDKAYQKIKPAGAAASAANEEFPYHRVVFLSASAKDEKAQDIPQWMLDQQGPITLDKKPHGRMTDALLRSLRGDADQNHDGRVTYKEMHEFTQKTMRGIQNPQLQAASKGLADQPVFGVEKAPAARPPASRGGIVRVRVDSTAADLRDAIGKLTSVQLADSGAADFFVSRIASQYALALESGLELRRYPAAERGELVARIAAEPRVRKLMDWSYPNQTSNVTLTFRPEGRGVYHVGEEIYFKMSADRESFFLLVNIDTAGLITVVYPPPGKRSNLTKKAETGGGVTAPTGAEYMKLFAFTKTASDPSRWAGAAFTPASEQFNELLRAIDRGDGAEASLVLFSAPKKQ